MGIASDLALLSLDPETGRNLLGVSECDAVFGGAVLVDLALSERVEVTGAGARAKVHPIVGSPMGDAVLDAGYARIRPGSNRRASTLVPRLGKGARGKLLDQLADEGAVIARRHRIFGIFPVMRHDVVDADRRDRLVQSMVSVLAGEATPDDRTGPLIALLAAGNVVKRLVPTADRKIAVKRAKEIADGEWAGAASKAAIDAANAAVSAAVTASIVSASVGGAGS